MNRPLIASLLLFAGCFGGPTYTPVRESNCADGIDEDEDGVTDCADRDCISDAACIEDCGDGDDNDLDGEIDCRDDDCRNSEQCIEICLDGIDNDDDGALDCDDSYCANRTPCVEDCSNQTDDDFDGTIGCRDSDCQDTEWCEELCTNGIDDDFDGALDCQDRECLDTLWCQEECANGVDDDFDGDLDCDDDECACGPEGAGLTCEDGVDNDLDGLADCDDPACVDRLFCTCEGTMRGGECFAEPWPGEVDGPISYIRSVKVPLRGSQVDCCFDFDGDGNNDNGYALLVGATRALGEIGRDADEIFENQIGRGDQPMLIAWEPGVSEGRWLYRATNDLDGDGAADQDEETRWEGNGVFQILASSVDEYGALDQFNDPQSDDSTASGYLGVRLAMPVLFLRGLHEVPLRQARIRGDYAENELGAWSIDEEAEIDGELIEFGGIELGGVVAIDDIAAILEDELAQCECAGFDLDEPILVYGETDSIYELACAQTPDRCTDDPNPLCENASLMCSFLPSMPSFGMNDIDANGNGIGESLSVGLRLSAAPAGLALPAIAP